MTQEPLTRRRAQTRERLMDAALALFAERGVLAASVEEICERAGFTRGAFYSNFESKDELCLAVMRREAENDLAAARTAIATVPGGLSMAELDAMIPRAVEIFMFGQRSEEAALALAELRLYGARTPAVREAIASLSEEFGRVFVETFDGALVQIGRQLSIPTGEAIELLNAVCSHAVISARLHGRPTGFAGAKQLTALLRSLIVRSDDQVAGAG